MPSVDSQHARATERGALQRLLGEYDANTFLREQFGQQLLHVRAASPSFADLFAWDDLNAILNQGFAFHPRLRLLKAGVSIDPSSYTYELSGRLFPDSRSCQQWMANGATLILEAVERANPRLDAFINALKHDFSADISCGLAATFALVKGLATHWDPYECFNVQIDGEKEWQLFSPTRPYPLNPTKYFPQRHDVEACAPPSGSPIWSGVLKPGDMLYVPRGWWHSVTPTVVPSLHLTIGIDVPTINDFLLSHARRASQHECTRRMLPTWASADERRRFAAEALAAVTSTLSAEAIEAYLRHTGASPRQEFMLPTAATLQSTTLEAHLAVRLRSPTELTWTTDNGHLTFEWLGRAYEFDAGVVQAFERLNEMRSCTVRELCEGSEPIVIKALLQTLLHAGIIAVTARP